MKLTILLLLLSIVAFSQSKTILSGNNLKQLPFQIPGYYLLSGTGLKTTLTTDIAVKTGTTGSFSLDDTTAIRQFIANTKGLTLNYTVTGGVVIPPVPVIVIEGEAFTSGTGVSVSGTQMETTPNSTAIYKDINFGSKTNMSFLYSLAEIPNQIVTVRLDSPIATPLAVISLVPTLSWGTYKWGKFPVTITGTHTLYLSFSRGFRLDQLKFE